MSDSFARVPLRFLDAFGDGEVASMRAVLAPIFATRGDPEQIARLRRVFLGDPAGVDALADAIVAVLTDGVPRTATEIASDGGVRRRRLDVAALLDADARFVRVAPPPGRSRRAQTWTLAAQGEGQVGTSARRAS